MIDANAVAARVQQTCGEMGLSPAATQRLVTEVISTVRSAARGDGDGQGLQSELQALRADRDVMAERQQEIMRLLNAKSPDRILHDLRNVLNELVLLKAITSEDDEES
jgi:hypothetical protein